MTNNNEAIEDILDILAQTFDKIANELWDKGRERRNAGAISREEYSEIKDNCRSLSRRAMELTTSSSRGRIGQLSGNLADLKAITEDLKQAKERIQNIEAGLKTAVAAVAAVTTVITAVTAPNPASILAATKGVADLVAAVS